MVLSPVPGDRTKQNETHAPNVGLANIHTLKTQKDARVARLYKTYCYSITYLCVSVSICGSFKSSGILYICSLASARAMATDEMAAVAQRRTSGPSVVGKAPFWRSSSYSSGVKSPSGPTQISSV